MEHVVGGSRKYLTDFHSRPKKSMHHLTRQNSHGYILYSRKVFLTSTNHVPLQHYQLKANHHRGGVSGLHAMLNWCLSLSREEIDPKTGVRKKPPQRP